MTPVLPSISGPSSKRSTAAWFASTSVAALLVTAVAALAMAYEPAGESMGEDAQPMLVMLPPTPAVQAMAEPTPEVTEDIPEEQPDTPVAEEVPDTPDLVEDTPDTPEVVEPEEVLAEDVPVIDKEPPPTPMAEVPAVKPKEKPPAPEKPKKTAEKKEKKKEPPKKKKAAAPAAESSAAAAPSKATTGSASVGAGKASAESYGATVMKKISRTKKKRAGEKGTATVSFTVTASGGLGSVSIARSSGSAKVDQVAMDHVRRAAPFPPPPPGAKTSYSVKVDAK